MCILILCPFKYFQVILRTIPILLYYTPVKGIKFVTKLEIILYLLVANISQNYNMVSCSLVLIIILSWNDNDNHDNDNDSFQLTKKKDTM